MAWPELAKSRRLRPGGTPLPRCGAALICMPTDPEWAQ